MLLERLNGGWKCFLLVEREKGFMLEGVVCWVLELGGWIGLIAERVWFLRIRKEGGGLVKCGSLMGAATFMVLFCFLTWGGFYI